MSRITIVEDDCFMREELADILEKEGYKVTQICDFQNVYEEIQKSRPALVLLDINLPQKSGFEICKQLKEKNLCPVIILTSRTQIEDEIHGLKLGADDFLTKPYHKGQMCIRDRCRPYSCHSKGISDFILYCSGFNQFNNHDTYGCLLYTSYLKMLVL